MSRICFEFDSAKLANAIAFFASRGVPKLDKLKSCKLLFFADKDHLLKHGRPILGDVYFCMPHGPVPSYSKNLIDDTLDGSDASADLLKLVKVVRTDDHKYEQFVAQREPDLGAFSRSEIESLELTVLEYGHYDAWTLRNRTHNEPCWVLADKSKPDGVNSVSIPYEYFFEGTDADTRSILELMVQEQENRDFAKSLTG